MWEREAMWIEFQTTSRFAVRAFIGRVNAISGSEMEQGSATQRDGMEQDYRVTPNQPWLDGICVAPGVVRQFVAMPRKFSISYNFSSQL